MDIRIRRQYIRDPNAYVREIGKREQKASEEAAKALFEGDMREFMRLTLLQEKAVSPTEEEPGTERKVEVLAERLARGEGLFHPKDQQRVLD